MIERKKKQATILWRNTKKLMSSIIRRFLFPPVIQRGLRFKLMLNIRTTLSRAQCKSTFSANLFSSVWFYSKWNKTKKTRKLTMWTQQQTKKNTFSRVLRQILMYLNHLWVCLVFYKVLAIFNNLSHLIRPITRTSVWSSPIWSAPIS